ncbi:MAG: methyltransferase [Crocinitomicaceae bacterium]|nr:methyltransferase [Crocinitomicaceae bacterium]
MSIFHFKHFSIQQENCSLKVGTDAMVLGALLEDNNYQSVLDIGTGSGVLALIAKQKNKNAQVTAIDIDELSLIDCQENFNNSQWRNDLHCFQVDIFDFTPTTLYDCIICNPPFYDNGYLSIENRVNQAKHTVNFSVSALLSKISTLLQPEGDCWMIFPHTSEKEWLQLAENAGLFPQLKINIYSKENKPTRLVIKFKKYTTPITVSYFTLRNRDNSFTQQYIEITKDLHLKSFL